MSFNTQDGLNVDHAFELQGMKLGDWFIGCQKCWFRFDANAAVIHTCPECHSQMKIYTVTATDLNN